MEGEKFLIGARDEEGDNRYQSLEVRLDCAYAYLNWNAHP